MHSRSSTSSLDFNWQRIPLVLGRDSATRCDNSLSSFLLRDDMWLGLYCTVHRLVSDSSVLELVPPHKAIPYSLLVRSFWLRGVKKSFRMAGMRPSGRLKILSLVMGPGSAIFLLIRPRDEDAIISLLNAEMIVASAVNIFSLLLFVAPL